MSAADRQQLVCFFYLLTRGTPDSPGMSWGDVKGLVRQVGAPPRVNVYSSPAGESLAHELLDELLTGVRPSDPLDSMTDDELTSDPHSSALDEPASAVTNDAGR